MNLVSIVATLNYITVVTDGRVSGVIPIQEKYQKFIKINDTLFVAYAGTKAHCEDFIKESGLLDITSWELKDLSRCLEIMVLSSKYKGENILLGIGGINRKNKIVFLTFNNSITGKKCIKKHIPTKKEPKFAYLYNSVNEKKLKTNVYNKLVEQIKITGIQKAEDVIRAQIAVNDYVSDYDIFVNKNTFKLIITRK